MRTRIFDPGNKGDILSSDMTLIIFKFSKWRIQIFDNQQIQAKPVYENFRGHSAVKFTTFKIPK